MVKRKSSHSNSQAKKGKEGEKGESIDPKNRQDEQMGSVQGSQLLAGQTARAIASGSQKELSHICPPQSKDQ